MKFSIKDFFSKCDQICSFLRIWSHLPKKSLMEHFIFCAVDLFREQLESALPQHDFNNLEHDTFIKIFLTQTYSSWKQIFQSKSNNFCD